MDYKKFLNLLWADTKELRRKSLWNGCFYDDNEDCSSEFINAHTISKKRVFEPISLNGHLVMFNPQNKDPFNATISEVGLQDATVFKGFCNKHDNQIFSPIDNSKYKEGERDKEFLFAYRALAKRYYTDVTKYNMTDIDSNSYQITGKFLPEIYRKIQMIVGFKKMVMEEILKNMKMIRAKSNSIVKAKEYSQIETKRIVFNNMYPLATSDCIFPLNNDLEIEKLRSKGLIPLFLNIFPQGNTTFVLFSYFKTDSRLYSDLLSRLDSKSESEKHIYISRLIIKYAHNFVLSPKVWNGELRKDQKRISSIYRKLKTHEKLTHEEYGIFKNLNFFHKII